MRCEFFGKVIRHYASNLSFQVEITEQYKQFIDSSFNVRGIMESTEFVNKISDAKQSDTVKKSPLVMPLMFKINQSWKHLSVLNTKILT
jgi:hypothetical protein